MDGVQRADRAGAECGAAPIMHDYLARLFGATWIVLSGGLVLFYWRAGLEAKRRWHPWFAFGTAGLFILFVALMAGLGGGLIFVAPIALLIAFLNWRFTKFCPACGRTIFQNPPWSRVNFCPKCGARLDGPAPPPKAAAVASLWAAWLNREAGMVGRPRPPPPCRRRIRARVADRAGATTAPLVARLARVDGVQARVVRGSSGQ